MSNNQCVLKGNLGEDPKILKGKEKEFAVFNLATCEQYEDKEGERKSTEPEWHNVIVFDSLTEKINDFKKGDFVKVQGRLIYRSKEREGIKYEEAQIKANNIEKIERFN